MPGRRRKRMTARLLRAATRYGGAAAAARGRCSVPMKDKKAKPEAARLIAAALEYHAEWTEWRSENGRPPVESEGPLPPVNTPEGRVIRSAKSLGYAKSRRAGTEELSKGLKRLLAAAENLARSDREKNDVRARPNDRKGKRIPEIPGRRRRSD